MGATNNNCAPCALPVPCGPQPNCRPSTLTAFAAKSPSERSAACPNPNYQCRADDMNNPKFEEIGMALVQDEPSLVLRDLNLDLGAGKKKEFDFQDEVARMLNAAKEGREEKGG